MAEGETRPTIPLSEMQRRVAAAAVRLASDVAAINDLGDDAEARIDELREPGAATVVLPAARFEEWNRLRVRLETALARTMANRYEILVDEIDPGAGGQMTVEIPDGAPFDASSAPTVRWQVPRERLLLEDG